jgi:hypothetical protein
MRWRWIMCGILVLLSGCIPPPSTAQNKAFVHKLVGYCAEVDKQMAIIQKSPANTRPGKIADQLDNFASKARSQHPPKANRQQLDALLAAFDDAARQYRTAQTALANGNVNAAHVAIKQANSTMKRADSAAVRYGMPHLKNCPKALGGHRQSPPPGQVAGGWQLGSVMQLAVQQAPAAALGGRIWVVGGLIGAEQSTAKTEVYDPTVHTWGFGPSLPVPLNHAMMVNYQGSLWVIGGFVPRGSNPTAGDSARVWILNKDQHGWHAGPPIRHARAAAAAAVVGNKIVVAGGRTGDPGKLVGPTEVYDGTSWHDTAAIPILGDHLGAASDGKYLYAVGGQKLASTDITAAVQRFNPATGRWTTPTHLQTAATNVGAAVIGGRLITFGGENLGGVFNTVRAYNLATTTWSDLPNLHDARHGMGVAVIGHALYAVGGAAKPGHHDSTRTLQVLRLPR